MADNSIILVASMSDATIIYDGKKIHPKHLSPTNDNINTAINKL